MKPIIVIGGGGHAKVLMEALLLAKREVIGYTDPQNGEAIFQIPWLGSDQILEKYLATDVLLVNGLGSIGDNTRRKHVFDYWKTKGYFFANVIHPTAVVSPYAVLEEGVQVMAGAVIQPAVHIGFNAIINTRSVVDHDTRIGDHVHIAPGAVLSGSVVVGDNVHIGTGAAVIQGISIGENSIVGAGAVVVKDVLPNRKVAGVPAKELR
ncbi:acetyltransferase [Brevibacillus gelatini]|uniref:Acetyltransferase n=1 Tax=Brevibacillus gelatini TaxID=1655277 RepID=A0A3M8ARN8_9BACL|nr:acetyltransferase [Brevibacillus gelatini]RNB53842.1 acetyltransferase [Brevibacillus gelatini]